MNRKKYITLCVAILLVAGLTTGVLYFGNHHKIHKEERNIIQSRYPPPAF